jgi:ATP-dependent Clp protease ATP-binding subunit ClpA
MATQAVQLDVSKRSVESTDFETQLRRNIVGQDEAVEAVVDLYEVFRAGMNRQDARWETCCSLVQPAPETPRDPP